MGVRPLFGVVAEMAALTCFLALSLFIPRGFPFGAYVVAAELLATYFLHCPAHYLVGSAVGIRFRKMTLGRTTLARVLPKKAARLARLLPVLTLIADKPSLSAVSRKRAAAMYASGTFASVFSALLIGLTSTWAEPPLYSAPAWGVAVAYLAFDLVFSPRSGDLFRARVALSG